MSEITENPSGVCGDSLTWTLDNDGVLKITGTGVMTGYILANPFDPTGEEDGIMNYSWDREKTGIFEIQIDSGAETIGEVAFSGIQGLSKITIPDTVTSIGPAAFIACNKLDDIYYGGTPAQWAAIRIAEGNDRLEKAELHFAHGAAPSTCPGCGRHVQPDFMLCPYCGTKLS